MSSPFEASHGIGAGERRMSRDASNVPPIIAPGGSLWPDGQDWLWFAGIVATHAALLAGAMFGPARVELPVTPPTVIGSLVAASPPAEALPPKPLPPASQPPKPRPVQWRKPAPPPPVPNASPPSEQVVNAPPVAPIEAFPSARQETVPVVATPATSLATPPPSSVPIIPPRTDAAHLDNPAPKYPVVSRRLGEQGRVLLDVYILPDGSVGEIKLKRSSGYARLDEAGLDAVRRWRYVPAHRGNEPIPYWYVQPVTFSLDS